MQLDNLTILAITSISGTLLLVLVHWFLYQLYREAHIGVWACAWFCILIQDILLHIYLANPQYLAVGAISYILSMGSGLLLLWGTIIFLEHRFSRWWFFAPIFSLVWLFAAFFMGSSEVVIILPGLLTRSIFTLLTGIAILRAEKKYRSSIAIFAGWVFIIWALHILDYPWLSAIGQNSVEWGYIVSFFLRLMASVGILLLYFQSMRKVLSQSERRSLLLFDRAADAIFIHNAQGKLIEVNQAACQQLGFTEDELLTRSFAELQTMSDRQRISDILGNLQENREILFETSLLTHSGKAIAFEFSTTLIIEEGEHLFYSLARNIDIRKAAEKAERNQRILAEALQDTAVAVNSSLKIDEVLEKILNNMELVVPFDAASIVLIDENKKLTHLIASRDYQGVPLERFKELFDELIVNNYTHQIMWRTRSQVIIKNTAQSDQWNPSEISSWVKSYLGTPVIINDQVVGIINLDSAEPGFFCEEHARRMQIFAAQAAVAIKNAHLFEETKHSAAETETLRRAGAAVTTSLNLDETLDQILEQLQLVVPHECANVHMLDEDELELIAGNCVNRYDIRGIRFSLTENTPDAVVYRTRRPLIVNNLQEEYGHCLFEPFRSYAKSWLGVPLIIQDRIIGILVLDSSQEGYFTSAHARMAAAFADHVAVALENARLFTTLQQELEERKQMETSMLASQKMAALGTLSAGIAHEINSPLQVITGSCDSILDRIKRNQFTIEDIIRLTGNVRRNAWRVAETVRSLLTYARSSPGTFEPEDPNELVKDVLLLIEHQLRSWSNISVTTKLAQDIPPLICNREKILSVLINLLTNARDAMPGGGEISIRTRYDADTDRVQFDVQDNGSGISEDVKKRLFDPFFTTKAVGEGTGLGLSIVFGIVQSHGGEIELYSKEGEGTTFSILLPRQPQDSQAQSIENKVLDYPHRYSNINN